MALDLYIVVLKIFFAGIMHACNTFIVVLIMCFNCFVNSCFLVWCPVLLCAMLFGKKELSAFH